ncbi:MAG TPA: hypothetical protein V6D15_09490 [Oculatellaceae cyanobacterium]|jgi:PAS domain-containing protein
MELLKLINLPGWNWKLQHTTAILDAPSHSAALNLLQGNMCAIAATAAKLGGMVEIRFPGCQTPVRVTASMAQSIMAMSGSNTQSSASINSMSSVTSAILNQDSFDINELYFDPNPVYIFGHYDHTILFANAAALKAQGKTASEIIGKDGASLDLPEELDKIIDYLDKSPGTSLMEYEFPGYRWYKDPDTQIWRRKKMQFVENWYKIDFMDQPARLGKVLSAVDL